MKYIIEYRYKICGSSEWHDWTRSNNLDTRKEFSDYGKALTAVLDQEAKQNNQCAPNYHYEYRVRCLETMPEPTDKIVDTAMSMSRLGTQSISWKEPMYIIEYRHKETKDSYGNKIWSPWKRSANAGANGEYPYSEALRIAEKNQAFSGENYEYRAVPLSTGDPIPNVLNYAKKNKAEDKLRRIQAVLDSKTKAEQIQSILNEELT